MDHVERVVSGDLPLYTVEDELPPDEAADVRRKAVEELSGVELDEVGETHDAEEATSNVENAVGATRVPLGVAGPLEVEGEHADGGYYLPMATTEGALVASVNRGCRALADAGGATARVTKDGMTRAPAFRVEDVAAARRLADWTQGEGFSALKQAAESTTSHGELLDVEPHVAGDTVYLRFRYGTGDAMGMNMATVATRKAAAVVERETDAELVALSGNVCADKKPAAVNVVEGRGKSVAADVLLPDEVAEEVLKASPAEIEEVATRKTLVGSARAASLGANAHVANVVAAVFLATGQDVAQVVEASSSFTTMKARDDGLYASVTLPALELGTVGGGTGLPTQRQALELLGVAGGADGENARELAEVVAAAALAGEVSLHAALASDSLDDAHEELGR